MGNAAARPAAPLSRRHITSLDGLRGLAFLLVFARHYGLSSHLTSPLFRSLERWAQGGWVGVDLFFALSGFLITGILLDTAGHPHYFKNFLARRALRIFPLYYGVALLLLLLTPVLHLQWRPGHLWYLLYAGNFAYCIDRTLSAVPPSVNLLHLWALAVEEQFYLLWPWVISLIVRSGRRDRLLPLCLSLSGVALLLRVTLLLTLANRQDALEWSYAMLPTHMDGLLFGAVAALTVRERPLAELLPWARRTALLATGVLAVVVWRGGPDIYSVPMILAGFPALAVLFSSVLVLAMREGSAAGRLGNLRLLRFFGRYSYGMYVFHMLFWPGTAPLLGALQGALRSRVLGGFAYLAVILAATSVVSVLSYKLYESRWLRLKSRFADRPVSPAPAAAS